MRPVFFKLTLWNDPQKGAKRPAEWGACHGANRFRIDDFTLCFTFQEARRDGTQPPAAKELRREKKRLVRKRASPWGCRLLGRARTLTASRLTRRRSGSMCLRPSPARGVPTPLASARRRAAYAGVGCEAQSRYLAASVPQGRPVWPLGRRLTGRLMSFIARPSSARSMRSGQ